MKKYIVKLAEKEREELHQLIAQGRASARKLTHARILLKADSSEAGPSWTDQLIVESISRETIRQVLQKSALYEVFEPAEARRLIEKLEIHYTPKHGSWLNMAEIEFSVLSRQCLDHRIGKQEELQREVAAWQATRNARGVGINWRFTTADARIKLKHLYPSIAD